MSKPKLLITGISGFLAWHIQAILQGKSHEKNHENYQIYGTYYHHKPPLDAINLIPINLTNYQDIKNLFLTIKPDAVIHTAAASQPNYCQLNPDISYQINVTAIAHIAQLCAENNIPLIFTSTDLVFDGKNPPYTETSLVNPVNIYGEQKVLAEQKILDIYPQATIARMPLMYGVKTPTSQSFIQTFVNTLKEGKELNLFSDEYRTPVSGFTAAKGLLLCLENHIKGIIHLGGKQRLSRYEFGQILAEILEVSPELIKPCSQQDVKMSAPRPQDVSLNSTKAFNLGYNPEYIQAELMSLREQL